MKKEGCGIVFSSILFLCVFLPAVLILYYLCPRKLRNLLLLVVSLLFYAWGEPKYILLMLFTTMFDYASGLLIDLFRRREKPTAARVMLIVTVIVNLGLFGFYKYTDFMIGTVNSLTSAGFSLLKIALPIGISFYTFQTLSYTIDVYRGSVSVQKNPIDFAMFVTLFPQLIAGPIVRYSDIAEQLSGKRESLEKFSNGILRFLIGLGKKVILADRIGALYETIAATGPDGWTTVMAWTGALAFLFQIYFDFSGYSDMAIGLGMMFGFDFPENFHYPYEATSITDFWRRWHMTLSGWFREYLYIPLGGNRKGRARQILNLLIVWSLTGLWHGAAWSFLLWGVYFFLILFLEKTFLLKLLDKCPKAIRHLYTLLVVLFSFVIFSGANCLDILRGINPSFQATDLSLIGAWFRAMFGFGAGFVSNQSWYYLTTRLPLFIMLAVGCTHFPAKLGELLETRTPLGKKGTFVMKALYCFTLLFVSVVLLVSDSYSPFLYFRF